jgi:hypothetical protein
MKYLAFSITTSITSGLLVYWSYLSFVTGLSPIGLSIVGLLLTALFFLNAILIKNYKYKKIGVVGFFLFGLLLPYGLIVGKKWDLDKSRARRYQNTSMLEMTTDTQSLLPIYPITGEFKVYP